MDFLSCARPEKLAARMKFEVKRHFTIRTGRIADTCRIKFVFFPYQYLQNFSVSDQKSQRRSLSTIKHVLEGNRQKIFYRRSNVMDYNQIDGSEYSNSKTNYFEVFADGCSIYISCYKMELHVKYGKPKNHSRTDLYFAF